MHTPPARIDKERRAFARMTDLTGTLLSCATLLAFSAGCSSFSAGSDQSTGYRPERGAETARHSVRYETGARTDGAARTSGTSERSLQVDAAPLVDNGDRPAAPNSDAATNTRLSGAAEQHARVTMVASEQPPLTRAEIPSHEPRSGEFWVAGVWRGESGQYIWQPGRVEQSRSGQLYVPANWVPSSQGWAFTPEYWR